MLAAGIGPAQPPHTTHPDPASVDPFVLYARSLHDYTLRLWMDSRRQTEERVRARSARAAQRAADRELRHSADAKAAAAAATAKPAREQVPLPTPPDDQVPASSSERENGEAGGPVAA